MVDSVIRKIISCVSSVCQHEVLPITQSTLASSGRPKLRSQTSQVVHRSLPFPTLAPCRSVDSYEKLNRIAEGSYGVVYRARDKLTGEIVALKKLKLENEKNGFPVTSLREIQCLLMAKHPNIVNVKEIVVGESLNNIFMAMEFVPHDLKTLMETMRSRNTAFLISEVKTLMIQLLSGVKLLHDLWIIHRDLKTSNLLMTNTGHVKIADFGLARSYGDPPVNLTQLVVTLWYRAPELLLGESNYTPAIDMWSIGCIFGELVNNEALMPGRGEIDQLNQIFRLLGSPTEDSWPNWTSLPNARTIQFANVPQSSLRQKFPYLTQLGLDLLSAMLAYDPGRRITAEEAMRHPWFEEDPLPKDPSQFPTWPSVASGERRKPHSPTAPHAHQNGVDDTDDAGTNTNALKGTAAEKGPSIFEFESKEGFASGFRLNFGKK
ncbi:Pkinase-domain-containing protein [Gonapodya prolifera JEL478]|uniref:Pkinase-domain-containing protein n=1 Tax=Gonapodya prolifera (strain JEL478) TaxID=1344416 RepID=A0A139AI30_GONPJ|nr:Pkinase-domain-containing protein [Gonapodya prolifera JEL478]|eukprot:KXS16085.1 Pkinase-domain-containing protein [Gonapodya prolifera JEL478]